MSAAYAGGAAGGAAGATAVAAAIANAIKASGAIVKMEPNEFMGIVRRAGNPAVVQATGGFLNRKMKYLTSYKGLFFYTMSDDRLPLPGDVELITANTIWIP